jgi:hypothetical protein
MSHGRRERQRKKEGRKNGSAAAPAWIGVAAAHLNPAL